MKDSYEQRIQNQFGAFCVKVLKNEARYIQRELASLQSQEKSLGELTASELEQTAVCQKACWPSGESKVIISSVQSFSSGVRKSHASPSTLAAQAALYSPAPMLLATSAAVMPASNCLLSPFSVTCIMRFPFLQPGFG